MRRVEVFGYLVFWKGRTLERAYFGKGVLWKGRTLERAYFGKGVLWKGRILERGSVRAEVGLAYDLWRC
jgi:hypothetical protein